MNDKAEVRLHEAFAALQLGQFDRAERLLQALLRKTPRQFDALIGRRRCAEAMRETDSAPRIAAEVRTLTLGPAN
jgi:uncharacterized protein HemY